MNNMEKLFYFLVMIFILLLISSIYKMHFNKKEKLFTNLSTYLYNDEQPFRTTIQYRRPITNQIVNRLSNNNNNASQSQFKYTKEPFIGTSSTLTPNTLTPNTLTPSTLAPNTLAPSTLTPNTLTPNTLTPNTLAPSTLAPSTLAPTTTNRYEDKLSKFEDLIYKINTTIRNIEEDNEIFRENQLKTVKDIYGNKKDTLFNNIEILKDKDKIYSDKLNKILQKNLDYSNDVVKLNQNIKESRVRELEKELSKIEQINNSQNDNTLKSLVCNANSTKLNIYPIKIGQTKLNKFLIFLNNNCLSYKIHDSRTEIKINNCEIGGKSDYMMNFVLKEIKDYNEYNRAIKIENSEQKALVMKNDDIIYPFYLVQPEKDSGKCLYISNKNIINIKSVTKSPNVRFRGSNTIGLCRYN